MNVRRLLLAVAGPFIWLAGLAVQAIGLLIIGLGKLLARLAGGER